MRKLFLAPIAAAAALTAIAPAQAQQRPILVVDTDRVLAECTACKAAASTIEGQGRQLQQRAQQLDASLKPEADALQKAVNALGGKQPDAALTQRGQAFQQKQQQAQVEIENRQRSIQSTIAHVRQQVGQRAAQIAEQVRARRQASVVLGKGVVIASDTAVDITGEVLTALNQQLPSVSVTPLPQSQQTSAQGR
jgi:outer membrane protein